MCIGPIICVSSIDIEYKNGKGEVKKIKISKNGTLEQPILSLEEKILLVLNRFLKQEGLEDLGEIEFLKFKDDFKTLGGYR